jgi:hypothetical protein
MTNTSKRFYSNGSHRPILDCPSITKPNSVAQDLVDDIPDERRLYQVVYTSRQHRIDSTSLPRVDILAKRLAQPFLPIKHSSAPTPSDNASASFTIPVRTFSKGKEKRTAGVTTGWRFIVSIIIIS